MFLSSCKIHFGDEGETVAEEIPGQQSFISNTQRMAPVTGNTGAYERLLAQEMDGQISLANLPQEKVVEKQITGQLNIEDILYKYIHTLQPFFLLLKE